MASKSSAEIQVDEFGQNDDFWLFGYGSLIWKPPPHYDQRIPGYIQGYVRRFWQASEDHRGTPEAPGRVVTLIDRQHWETLTDHHEPTEKVWGAAYHIPAAHVAEVRSYLDIREINGYSIQFTPFYPAPFTTNITSSRDNTAIDDDDDDDDDDDWDTAPLSTAHTTDPYDASSSTPRARARSEIHKSTEILTRIEHPTQTITCLVYIGLPENPQFMGPQDPDELARHILRSRGPSGENREYLYLLEKSLLELSAQSGDRHVSDLVKRARKFQALEREKEPGGDEAVGDHELHKVGSTEEQEEVEK